VRLILNTLNLLVFTFASGALALDQNAFESRGRWVIDGKPTFVVGLYVVEEPRFLPEKRGEMTARLDDIAASPFKLLVDYGNAFGGLAQRREVLDEMHRRGLKSFVSLEGVYADRWLAQGAPFAGQSVEAAVASLVGPVMDHPAIAGWYVCDEYPQPEPVASASQIVRKTDPTRPVLVCSNYRTAEKLRPFAAAADILAVDDYPIPRHRPDRVATTMSEMVKATGTQQPRWAIIQGCGGYVYKESVREHGAQLPPEDIRGDDRLPTPREMRCMTFLALTQDITGVLFYYYRDFQLAYDAKTRWQAVKSIAEEVQQVSPQLLADPCQEAITCDEPAIRFRATQAEGRRFIIAVNSSPEVKSGILTLGSSGKHVELLTGSGLAYVKDKSLLLTLDGYEAVVVEVD
jgi:hypothetical protein